MKGLDGFLSQTHFLPESQQSRNIRTADAMCDTVPRNCIKILYVATSAALAAIGCLHVMLQKAYGYTAAIARQSEWRKGGCDVCLDARVGRWVQGLGGVLLQVSLQAEDRQPQNGNLSERT